MIDPKLPQVDEAYIRQVFDALSVMQVDLDADPLIYGPKRLNAKVAECRQYLSKCQQIYLSLSDDHHRFARSLRAAKLDYEIKSQDLLTNDPNVRSGSSLKDREAVVGTILKEEMSDISDLEASLSDVNAVLAVVKAKKDDLKDVQGRIRDQHKLCQEEITLGSQWGSAPPQGAYVPVLTSAQRPLVPTAPALFANVDVMATESGLSDLDAFVNAELRARGETPTLDLELEMARVGEPIVPEKFEPEPYEKQVVEEPAPVVMPVIPLKNLEDTSTTTSSEIDDFFSVLDTKGSQPLGKKANELLPISAEIDLDDLLESLN